MKTSKPVNQSSKTPVNPVLAVWGSRPPTVNMTPFEMLKIIADLDAPGQPLPTAVFHLSLIHI